MASIYLGLNVLMGRYTIDADVEALSPAIQYIILTGSCSDIKNTSDWKKILAHYVWNKFATSSDRWVQSHLIWYVHAPTRAYIWITWWRHHMKTFSALLALCAGNWPVTGEFPSQRPVTRSFGVFFYLRLNKRLSKQWRRCWFETPSCSLWRHWNVIRFSEKNAQGISSMGLRLFALFHWCLCSF